MNYLLKCKHCGNEFTPRRITGKYCSDSCKTKANRQRRDDEQVKLAEEQLMTEINEKRRVKAEVQSKIKEQMAMALVEKLRKLEEERLHHEDLRLKAEQDVAALDNQKRKLETECKHAEEMERKEKATQRRLQAKLDSDARELKAKKDKVKDDAMVKIGGTVLKNILNAFTRPKNNPGKPADIGKPNGASDLPFISLFDE